MDDELHITGSPAVLTGAWWTIPWRQVPTPPFAALYAVFGPSGAAFHALTLELHFAITAAIFLAGKAIGSRLPTRHAANSSTAAFTAACIFVRGGPPWPTFGLKKPCLPPRAAAGRLVHCSRMR